MANKELATYLNNHLAASVSALALLSSIQTVQANSDIARFASELYDEIKAEQQELTNLMERLQIGENRPSQAAGWLAEKFTQVRLRIDDSNGGTLHLLESLELLLLGIGGKSGLWRALAHVAVPGLQVADYERLATRSEDQQRRVETMRLAAAKMALAA